MEKENKCQRCKRAAIASCTGRVDNMFGVKWPGGKIQKGFVPPHDLLGLREKDAPKEYMNFSWCLVCGQIQGEWPTKIGMKYAPEPSEESEES